MEVIIEYGKNFKKLKTGGSGTGLFATSRKQKAIPLDEEGKFFQPPGEPVVVKVAQPSDFYGAKQEAIDLVDEVKVLSAIGPHPNIIALVDAIPAKDGIYVFLEAGIEDLEDRAKRKKLGKKGNYSRLLWDYRRVGSHARAGRLPPGHETPKCPVIPGRRA